MKKTILLISLVLMLSTVSSRKILASEMTNIISMKNELSWLLKQKDHQVAIKVLSKKYPSFFDKFIDKKYLSVENIDAYFVFLKDNKGKLENLFEKFDKLSKQYISEFKKHYPEANLEFDIYGALTLNAFAGRMEFSGDKSLVGFGLDRLSDYPEEAFKIVFAHELFHAFHLKHLGLSEATKSQLNFGQQMWVEGMAVYASGLLNGISEDYRIQGKSTSQICKKNLKAWKNEAKQYFRMVENSESKELFKKWFSENPTPAYCVGYEIVKSMVERHSFAEITAWPISTIEAKLESHL